VSESTCEIADWTKSTYSAPNGGTCVEWAPSFASVHGVVPVRDSKVPGGPVLRVSERSWAGLVAMVRQGDV
jgi:hypothetical protein